MRKKGQITMESLLLYGAAILVVLLAIAALTYFGVLDLGRFLPEKCNFEGTGIFKCEEWKADSSGEQIQLVLSNKGTKSVEIDQAVFEASDSGMASGCDTGSGLGLTITPGSTGQIDIPCSNWNVDVGKRIGGKVTLTHKFSGGTLTTNTVGDIMITVS